jgi:hypothetical protein
MNPRPTYTKPDGNQNAVVHVLRTSPGIIDVWNISNQAGLLDIIVFGIKNGEVNALMVELKVDDAPLTGNEPDIIDLLSDCAIVARSPADDPMPAVQTILEWFE